METEQAKPTYLEQMVEIEKIDVGQMAFDSNQGDTNNDKMPFQHHQETESSSEDD